MTVGEERIKRDLLFNCQCVSHLSSGPHVIVMGWREIFRFWGV